MPTQHVHRPAAPRRREYDPYLRGARMSGFVEPAEPTTEEEDRRFFVALGLVVAALYVGFLWILHLAGVL